MGKHERDIVEEAEKIVAILVNGGDLSTEQKKHPFLGLIKKFVTLIKNEHRNIKIAKAIGNDYSTPGDICIELDNNKKRYIELKFLEKDGVGTLANISQNAMTSLGIFNCQSWQSFRKEIDHKQKVITLLNQFTYPFGKIKDSDPDFKISEAAEFLKEKINTGHRNVENVCQEHIDSPNSSENQKLISNLILKIIKMDRVFKIKYLSMLKNAELDKDKLKKFAFLVLTGSHTQEILNSEMLKDFSSLEKSIDNYDVYYLYKKTLSIDKEDNLNNLYKIFENDIGVEIKEDETNLIIYSLDGSIRTDLIRVVYHWKNKFQGIETPCLNIFKF